MAHTNRLANPYYRYSVTGDVINGELREIFIANRSMRLEHVEARWLRSAVVVRRRVLGSTVVKATTILYGGGFIWRI